MNEEAIGPIIIALLVIVGFVMLISRGNAKHTANEIGQIRCNRCGLVEMPGTKTSFVPIKGVSTILCCKRCGSEDWTAYNQYG